LRCPKHKSKFGGGLFVSFATGKCTTRSPCSRSDTVAAWAVPTFETKEREGVISIRPGRPRAEQPTAPAAAQQTSLAARLVRIRSVSPDSHEFTFQLLGEPDRAAFAHEPATMWHIWLTVGDVSREYTPTSSSGETASTGTITLLIKLYARGSMSEQLAKAATGDVVAVSPPRVTLRVPALLEEAPPARGIAFNLLAGGTGIAPCYQLLRWAKAAEASVRMIYSCWTYGDVLLAAELEELAACWPGQGFCYTLVLTRDTARRSEQTERQLKRPRSVGTLYGRRIDATIVREHLLMGVTETDGGGQPGAVMTIVSGPSGFNACCADAVSHALDPAARGQVFVLDA
jgi:ferredoxin-NADP reductase